MNEHDIPPLDDDVRALVRRAAKVQPAPAAARARVLDRVIHVLGPSGGGGGDGGSTGSPTGSPGTRVSGPDPSGTAMRILRRVLPLAASFALGGGAVAVAMHRASDARRPEESRVASGPETEPAERRPVETKGSADPPSQESPTSIVAPQAATLASAAALATSKPPPSSPSRDQLTAERQLLDVARGALEREEPQVALGAIARHERRYPNGALAQEREAIAIRALVLLGRTTEARARADRFRSRFPQSLLLPTIESTVGAGRTP